MEQQHIDVLSCSRQQSWYIPGIILQRTTQDVYVIEVRNNKAVEPDNTQSIRREQDHHGFSRHL